MRGTKAKSRQAAGAIPVFLLAVLYMLILLGRPALQVQAETSAKVTATSAVIRKEADKNSEAVASVLKDDTISIKAKTTGKDGNIWYQVYVDANTLGFIRSDLVQVSGEVTQTVEPDSSSGSSSGSSQGGSSDAPDNSGSGDAPPDDNVTAEITQVNPVSAMVKGENVQVRKNCTTNSSVVKTVEDGMAMTVTGHTAGADGAVWYQVSFIADGSELTGFVHSDFVTLSGELVSVGGDPGDVPGEPEAPPQETRDYETSFSDGKWYLYDNVNRMTYELPGLITLSENNAAALEKSLEKAKTQTTVIVILAAVIVIVLLVLALGVFKFKDELFGDSFGFREEPAARRRTVEPRRPAGQRPSGSSASRPSPRPSSQSRPSGSSQARPGVNGPRSSASGQTRPSGSQQRPAGAGQVRPSANSGVSRSAAPGQTRPSGSQPRPSGSSQARPAGTGGSRPAASQSRPSGSGQPRAASGSQPRTSGVQGPATDTISPAFDMTGQTARSEQIKRETSRSLEDQQIQKRSRPVMKEDSSHRKPKNFMTDDDEFEFEFLNWDGEEEN